MSCIRLLRTFLLSVLLVVAPVYALDRPTLAEVDAIIASAGNLDALLANETMLNAYFEGLHRYYGSRFTREAFDLIIAQLREIKEKVPELKARLWQEVSASKYQLQMDRSGSGRILDVPRWAVEREKIEASKAREAMSPDRAKEIIVENVKRVQEFEASATGLGKKAARLAKAEFYVRLRSQPDLETAFHTLAHLYLKSQPVQEAFDSKDPDRILEVFKGLELHRTRVLGPMFPEIPVTAWSLSGDLAPRAADLLQDTGMFKRVAASREVSFTPVPRRIHGIWKGVVLGECVGGKCTTERYRESLTPARWATSALKDTVVYDVEVDGRYNGFVQLVPIREKATGNIYASVDFGAPILKEAFPNGTSSDHGKAPAIELWVPRASAHLPPGWSGIVVSQSNTINNAKVLPSVRSSAPYVFGTVMGSSDSAFEHFDDLVPKIVSASEFKEHASTMKNDMIFDATLREAGALVRLEPDRADPGFEQVFLRDPKMVASVLEGSDRSQAMRLLEALAVKQPLAREVRTLLDEVRKSGVLTEPVASEARIVANQDIIKAMFAGLRREPQAFLKTIRSERRNFAKRGEWARYADALVGATDAFLESNPTSKEVREWLMAIEPSHFPLATLLDKVLPTAKSADEFIRMVRPLAKKPNSLDSEAIDNAILAHIDQLFSLNPTIQDLGRLEVFMGRVDTIRQYWKALRPRLKNEVEVSSLYQIFQKNFRSRSASLQNLFLDIGVDEFQVLFHRPADFVRQVKELKRRGPSKIDSLVNRAREQFLRLTPSIGEILHVKRALTGMDSTIAFMESAIASLRSPADFVALCRIEEKLPSKAYESKVNRFIIDHVDRFFTLNPSVAQVRALIKETPYVEGIEAILRVALERAESASAFAKLIDPPFWSPSEAYYKMLRKQVAENVEVFAKLKPMRGDVRALASRANIDPAWLEGRVPRAEVAGRRVGWVKACLERVLSIFGD